MRDRPLVPFGFVALSEDLEPGRRRQDADRLAFVHRRVEERRAAREPADGER
jgi:hypothetical protein